MLPLCLHWLFLLIVYLSVRLHVPFFLLSVCVSVCLSVVSPMCMYMRVVRLLTFPCALEEPCQSVTVALA